MLSLRRLGDQSVQLLVERFGGFEEWQVLLDDHERRWTHVGNSRACSARRGERIHAFP
jgi:hypothetical protein